MRSNRTDGYDLYNPKIDIFNTQQHKTNFFHAITTEADDENGFSYLPKEEFEKRVKAGEIIDKFRFELYPKQANPKVNVSENLAKEANQNAIVSEANLNNMTLSKNSEKVIVKRKTEVTNQPDMYKKTYPGLTHFIKEGRQVDKYLDREQNKRIRYNTEDDNATSNSLKK